MGAAGTRSVGFLAGVAELGAELGAELRGAELGALELGEPMSVSGEKGGFLLGDSVSVVGLSRVVPNSSALVNGFPGEVGAGHGLFS